MNQQRWWVFGSLLLLAACGGNKGAQPAGADDPGKLTPAQAAQLCLELLAS